MPLPFLKNTEKEPPLTGTTSTPYPKKILGKKNICAVLCRVKTFLPTPPTPRGRAFYGGREISLPPGCRGQYSSQDSSTHGAGITFCQLVPFFVISNATNRARGSKRFGVRHNRSRKKGGGEKRRHEENGGQPASPEEPATLPASPTCLSFSSISLLRADASSVGIIALPKCP